MVLSVFSRYVQQQWLKKGWWSQLLTPLSKATSHYAQKKRFKFLSGQSPSYQAPVPVIVVGNIFVGGTGKTPLVIALTQALQAKGHKVGIVSRGYGVPIGKEARFVNIHSAQTQKNQETALYPTATLASWIGDEPSVLAQYAPIAVHPQRAKAAQKLLQECPDTTVIISDDGLQHYGLARDIEIVVQDTRRVGNGLMLPAGPLREPVDRLKTVDFIITNYNLLSDVPSLIQDLLEKETHSPQPENTLQQTPTDSLASANLFTESQAIRHTANTSPSSVSVQTGDFKEVSRTTNTTPVHRHPLAITMYLVPTTLRQLSTGKTLSLSDFITQYGQQKRYAIAGIGNPQRFYQTLADCGLTPSQTQSFDDHHAFKASDLTPFQDGLVLMTAKDASKCLSFAGDNCWAVEVKAQFYPTDFFEKVVQLLDTPKPKKLNISVTKSGCCSGKSCGC
ncbi:tetraacyldisaccharide 4'-kinase [Pelistega europaea]|uniref:Tetraacyldisaccharide 4'-kinase n=1 Tax=Pelistega europaea TaxID=106147 RepID=A0A7Y4LA37_9BURK|nr:tetraacyldisaccharide 4'-kinase [Pelistega europaea]NOL49719.1 tetraacyldisaccharide 4'-kinase [Pelistega europaea]